MRTDGTRGNCGLPVQPLEMPVHQAANLVEPPKRIELLTYAIREPLPALTLALTSHFACRINLSGGLQPH